VDITAFFRQLERGRVPPVVLIHGAEGQLLDDALAAVSRRLFADPGAALFDRQVLDARETDVDAVLLAARTLPVQAPARLVAVRHAQALPARGADALARYAADPSPAACLLLLADEPLGAARDRKPHWLLQALPAGAVVEAGLRRGRALEEWLRQRAAAEGLVVSEEAARLLAELVGEDGAALLGEARKAALAGGPDNRAVGVSEVAAVVGERRVQATFELVRAIERREVGLALRTLDRLLATEEPLAVLGALVREVRTGWLVREWRARGVPVEEIARRLRPRPPAAVEALVARVGALPPAAFARRLARCWQAEWRLKSGSEPRAELAALVAELAA